MAQVTTSYYIINKSVSLLFVILHVCVLKIDNFNVAEKKKISFQAKCVKMK